MILNFYEINSNTCALVPINERETKIYELDRVITVNQNCMEIINNSCLKFGSSYLGRAAATKYAIGYTHKTPICINERTMNIFFPTKSPRLSKCSWISYNNVFIYSKVNKNSNVTFVNKKTVLFDTSYLTIQNQMFRASRLENYLKNNNAQKC